jgi:N-acetylglucosamine repressor
VRQERLARVFHSLYRHGQVSREAIAMEANLSAASVSTLTQSLLQAGVLRLAGELPSRGGRRADLLELNPPSRHLCGVDLQGRLLRMALVDLGGNVSRTSETRVETASPFTRFAEALRGFLQAHNAVPLAIGIATPELLDRDRRRMVSAHRVSWTGFDIRETVERQTRCTTFLTRSVDAAALGEKWFGSARSAENCLVITWGEGIGCGVLIGGELFSGSALLSGEFGHVTIDPDGAACYCGKRGCLEMYASVGRIVAACGGTFRGLCKRARQGDATAIGAIQQACALTGLRLADLVQVLNPEQIVLAGMAGLEPDLFLPLLRAAIHRHAMPAQAIGLRMDASSLGPDAGCRGAAASALQQLIDSPGGVDRLLRAESVQPAKRRIEPL